MEIWSKKFSMNFVETGLLNCRILSLYQIILICYGSLLFENLATHSYWRRKLFGDPLEEKIKYVEIIYYILTLMSWFFLYMYSCRYYREYQESSYAILDYTFRITNALLRILCTVSDFFFWYRGLVKFLATNNY